MPSLHCRQSRSRRRCASASVIAALLCALPASAADRAPTPEGADALRALVAKFLPTAQTGASPLVTVTPESADYLISVDLSAVGALLSHVGLSFAPATVVYKGAEQDDGNWRLMLDSLPRIAFQSEKGSGSVELANFRSAALISPALAWLLSGSASADKGTFRIATPNAEQSIDFGAVQENVTTNVGAEGSVSTLVKENLSDVAFNAAGIQKDDAPFDISGRIDTALIEVGVDGFKSRKAFDLWSLLASHRSRIDLAAHQAELKGLLRELAAPGLEFAEGIDAQKTLIVASIGAITLADVKYRLAAANAGPESSIRLDLSAEGLGLPAGLVAPQAGDLMPSKIDVTATLKGVDLAAAANTWIEAFSLEGDGPVITDEDADKVHAALLSAGPIRIEFAPSHILAPAVDADFTGVVRFDHGKPAGAMTVHMRGFDKTMAAVKALGPEVAAKALPAMALAKGFSQTDSDGSLSWLVELDPDGSLMVNGVPFGKAPN